MDQDASRQESAPPDGPKADPWEGVPPGCGTPRPGWPMWLALVGFVLWVGFLLVLMVIRLRTSAA